MKNVSVDEWDWCIDDETRLDPWFRIYREVEEKFTVKSDDATRVFRVQDSRRRCYFVKHITPSSIREHLIAFFSSKAKNICESSQLLRSLELPCVNYPGWGKNGTESMILSEEIPETEPALEYWFRSCAQNSARRREFVSNLAGLISRCITSSVLLPDISLDNILIKQDGSSLYLLNPINAETSDEALSQTERTPYLNPFIELRGEISPENISIALHEAGFSGNSIDISELLRSRIDSFEEEIEDGNWPDYAMHVLEGEPGPLYRTVQKENSLLRVRNTIWRTPVPEPNDANSVPEDVPEEEAQEIWTDSFKAMLLRYHCARVPLSWELFEDGRSILRYATAYDDIFASGFDQ